MTAVVLRGDARRLPLPDGSVDLICCSPPYFGLRSYVDTVKCYDCIQMEYNGRDPRQAWPDYDAHVREVHQRHYDGQIGSEATPGEWVAALVACTAEWVRVLKPSGSIFVNLGDKYDSGTTTARINPGTVKDGQGQGWHQGTPRVSLGQPKSLLGLPWRYALACMDELGLILRRDIIWSKPNGLPESVTDRCRSSHEYLFHFTVRPRYYAAVDEIRTPHQGKPQRRLTPHTAGALGNTARDGGWTGLERSTVEHDGHPLGALPGSVWEIPSQPLSVPAGLGVDHFAAYPTALVRPIILAWSPLKVCMECKLGLPSERSSYGQASTPAPQRNDGLAGCVQTRTGMRGLRHDGGPAGLRSPGQGDEALQDLAAAGLAAGETPAGDPEVRYSVRGMPHEEALGRGDQGTAERAQEAALRVRGALNGSRDVPEALHEVEAARRSGRRVPRMGAAYCTCPAGTSTGPGLVVDPFGGTGTTALVASMLGRTGVSVDLSADYCRLARWRTTDPGERARALQVPKPPPVPDGQGSLFDDLEAS